MAEPCLPTRIAARRIPCENIPAMTEVKSAPTSPPILLPAALLSLWADPDEQARGREIRSELPARPGVFWIDSDLLAVVPIAGDAAVYDVALSLGVEILGMMSRCRILIHPGRVRFSGGSVESLPTPLLADFMRKEPDLPSGGLYLTSYAARRLESPRRLAQEAWFEGSAGERIPLLRWIGEDTEASPWRNTELLRRRPAYIDRPEVDGPLRQAGSLRVSGALGSGKTRAVANALAQPSGPSLWVSARPERHQGPSLASQILHRLLTARGFLGLDRFPGLAQLGNDPDLVVMQPERLLSPGSPLPGLEDAALAARLLLSWLRAASGNSATTVAIDHLESAGGNDRDLVDHLLEELDPRGTLRLLLIGRTGGALPASWSRLPEVEVPALSFREAESVAAQLFAGLSLAPRVERKLVEESAGYPFALEEGLLGLVHHGLIRQVYGSFFFRGTPSIPYLPSERWMQHVEAEAARIGNPAPLRSLGLAELAAPPEALRAATIETGFPVTAGWERAYEAACWLEASPSAWGVGVVFRCPAIGRAFAEMAPRDTAQRLRQALGRAMQPVGDRGQWQRYRLLVGSTDATEALLQAVDDPQAPSADLAAALAQELAALRQRGGSADLERELLWNLLPLARRLDELRDHEHELARALELTQDDPRRWLAFSGLAADHAEQNGKLAEAEELIREALRRSQASNDSARGLLVVRLARLLLRQERQQEARDLLEQVLPVLEAGGAKPLVASCLFYLGNVAMHQERLQDALELHSKALGLRREKDKPRSIGASLSALGRLSLRLGHYPEALAFYREAEGIFVSLQEDGELAYALLGVGAALARLGDDAGASMPLRQALALRDKGDDPIGRAIARLAVAENALRLQRLPTALREARQAHFDLRMLPNRTPALGDSERLMGIILARQRQYASARERFVAAYETHSQLAVQEGVVLDLAAWIELALVQGDEREIRRLTELLTRALPTCPYLERVELIELRLFQGRDWLANVGDRADLAHQHLVRAYEALMSKAEHLDPSDRHRFLYQVAENEAVVAAATQHHLVW